MSAQLPTALSAYLDGLRFVAALAVLVGHAASEPLGLQGLTIANFSHEAVMVFFVLSGFIIHQTTVVEPKGARAYWVSRTARVASVAVPAVLFCVLVAVLLGQASPDFRGHVADYSPPTGWNTVGSLLFLNAAWWGPGPLTMNGAYWSLCYEVWFYVLFGLYLFARGRLRWVMLGLAAALAGPSVLALMPVWLMGVWLSHRRPQWPRLLPAIAVVLFLLPVALAAWLNHSGLDMTIKQALHAQLPGYWRLEYSQRMVTDLFLAWLACLHIMAFGSLPPAVQRLFEQRRQLLTSLAGFSFTLYLFHLPLTQLLGAWAQGRAMNRMEGAAAVAVIALACWLISHCTERQLPKWRRLLNS